MLNLVFTAKIRRLGNAVMSCKPLLGTVTRTRGEELHQSNTGPKNSHRNVRSCGEETILEKLGPQHEGTTQKTVQRGLQPEQPLGEKTHPGHRQACWGRSTASV